MPPSLLTTLERLLRFARLQPDGTFTPKPVAIAGGLWTIDRRARLLGLPDPCTCTLARVDSGDLVLIGAPSFFASCHEDVRHLGRVVAVVAPNSFHHMFAREVIAVLGSPTFVVAPGLPERISTLPPAVELGPGSAPPWSAGLESAVFGPVRGVSEIVFFHVATRTLILTDIASNIVEFERPFHRWVTRAYGIRPHFGPSRNARVLLRSDRTAAARLLGRALEWPFERIIVAHGSPVNHDARDVFRDAFADFL
jgi:hypothetical protein